MYLSRITIQNFRNFKNLDIELSGDAVFLGENRVGKTNLVYALRLLLDPSLPDSARQLSRTDFWDGLESIDAETEISVQIEISDFEDDASILALLTDYRLSTDAKTVRLNYIFRADPHNDSAPSSDEDFLFLCFGGENESNNFGHQLRKRILVDLLPALRDAEGDLASWSKSPLRPLIDEAFKSISDADLTSIGESLDTATDELLEFDSISALQDSIQEAYTEMSGPKHDVHPWLGFTPTDLSKLRKSLSLLIDDGKRSVRDASLGSANIIYLTLKMLDLERLLKENHRNHTVLAIEEPEAHLHPQLQRQIYNNLFEEVSTDGEEVKNISLFLTTHSPHIASVAPLNSLILLKDTLDGTAGKSVHSIDLSPEEEEDLSRYLDVSRAEILFARGVVLVEGIAEQYLIPAFAKAQGYDFDSYGISVCSVSGTNFHPYVKFLTGLDIPFVVLTDWDPRAVGKKPLGFNRLKKLATLVDEVSSGEVDEGLADSLIKLFHEDHADFKSRCEDFGLFTNGSTLETQLLEEGFAEDMVEALQTNEWSKKGTTQLEAWETDSDEIDPIKIMKFIEHIGKGRFAQRLSVSFDDSLEPPTYILNAIKYLVERV